MDRRRSRQARQTDRSEAVGGQLDQEKEILEVLKEEGESLRIRYQSARLHRRNNRKQYRESKQQNTNAIKAQALIQEVALQVQEKAHEKIAGVVSKCIRSVFEDDGYDFQILFEKKRGKTEARLVFVKDGIEFNPTGSVGGGILDVASLALRLACLSVRRPHVRKLLILDEPFKNINGEEYQARAGVLLERLSKEMDFQFIIVTDDDWLKIGTIIEI